MISGYNLPHIAEFSAEERHSLAQKVEKGMAYRIYGGEETRRYTLNAALVEWLKEVEGRPIYVYTDNPNAMQDVVWLSGQFPGLKIENENERYIFPAPNLFRDFRGWVRFTFDRPGYFRDLAKEHIKTLEDGEIYNLPLKVTQNAAYRAYAEVFLDSDIDFEIDLHVFGSDPQQFANNLRWYKSRTSRRIHFLEFNGTTNERFEATIMKNTEDHAARHAALLDIARLTLGDQLGEVLYFTLCANEKTQNWKNPSYLHRFEVVDGEVYNTIYNVWPSFE